jgi:hypothetical protein
MPDSSIQTEPVVVEVGAAAAPPASILTVFDYPAEKARYTMRFSSQVERLKGEDHRVKKEQVEEARNQLAEERLWREWTSFLLRDAVELDIRLDYGREVYLKDAKVTLESVTLDAQIPKSKWDPDSWKRVEGTVVWTGPLAKVSSLITAADWRINDRMCYYGVQEGDVKTGWIAYTRHGLITVQAL